MHKKRIAIVKVAILPSGGDEGDRTPYLLNAIQALSQVSYTPILSEKGGPKMRPLVFSKG